MSHVLKVSLSIKPNLEVQRNDYSCGYHGTHSTDPNEHLVLFIEHCILQLSCIDHEVLVGVCCASTLSATLNTVLPMYQVIVAPLVRLTNKASATLEEIGTPEGIVESIGAFITGVPLVAEAVWGSLGGRRGVGGQSI